MNGADALCDTLLAGGVDTCFANPGTSEMHFVAALDRKPKMRCVLGLFEGVVTGAADGYARMAEKPAATLLHLGPGLANGLANLHNAKRARSPVVNIVGDHATYHLKHDAPLTSDIEGLARPMSHWVHRVSEADHVSRDAAQAITQARTAPGRIATLILAADAAWTETTAPLSAVTPPLARAQVLQPHIAAAVAAIRSGRRTTLMLSGVALRANALEVAGRIAKATGVRLLAQQSNARMERGAGRMDIERVPYPVEQALAALKDIEQLILVGAKAPVAFFAYPGKPSSMLPRRLFGAATGRSRGRPAACAAVAGRRTGRGRQRQARRDGIQAPGSAHRRVDAGQRRHGAGRADAGAGDHLRRVGHFGRNLFQFTRTVPQHDYLQLTGGAIGEGLPMALGAAIACPAAQGDLAGGRRQRHVHAAGPVDPGARGARRRERSSSPTAPTPSCTPNCAASAPACPASMPGACSIWTSRPCNGPSSRPAWAWKPRA